MIVFKKRAVVENENLFQQTHHLKQWLSNFFCSCTISRSYIAITVCHLVPGKLSQ